MMTEWLSWEPPLTHFLFSIIFVPVCRMPYGVILMANGLSVLRKPKTWLPLLNSATNFSFLIKSNKLLGVSYNLLNREIKVHVFIVTESVNNWINSFFLLSSFVVTSTQFTKRKQPLPSLTKKKNCETILTHATWNKPILAECVEYAFCISFEWYHQGILRKKREFETRSIPVFAVVGDWIGKGRIIYLFMKRKMK